MTFNEQFPGLLDALKAREHLVPPPTQDLPHKREDITTFVTELTDKDFLILLELLALIKTMTEGQPRIMIIT